MVDRPHREEEPLGDLAVAKARGEELEHLELACGQARGIVAGRLARASRQPADAQLTQAPGDDRGCGLRLQAL